MVALPLALHGDLETARLVPWAFATLLFGTDFPVLTPERWMADFEKIAIRAEVKPGIFKNNAARLLGLAN